MAEASTKSCNVCKKVDGLKRCNACRNIKDTWYCSKDCQKVDWKMHKKQCMYRNIVTNVNIATTAASNGTNNSIPDDGWESGNGLQLKIDKPFTRLQNQTWLHDRPETDIYKLLIDAFRLRLDDSYKFEGNVEPDSIYAGKSSMPAFKRFLNKVMAQRHLLPSWWSDGNRKDCEKLSAKSNKTNWADLTRCVEKNDIMSHYDDQLMPMQLRMFAEQVYGSGIGGQSGKGMLQIQILAEEGNISVF